MVSHVLRFDDDPFSLFVYQEQCTLRKETFLVHMSAGLSFLIP